MTRITLVFPGTPQNELRYWAYIIEALEKQGLVVSIVRGWSRWVTLKRNSRGYDRGVMLMSPNIIWKIVREAPDFVLVIEYSIATLFAYLAARASGGQLVIFQEHASRVGFEPGPIKRLWRKMLLKLSDLIIANTEEAKKEILEICPTCYRKVKVVPLLVPPNQEEMMKKAVDLPKDTPRPIFTYIGRLIPIKNVDVLVEAADILKRAGYQFSIWIVGDGPERKNLERVVKKQDLENTVRFLGSLPYESLGFVYEQTDVFVMPTLSDYRAVAVLEALRFGKPVIDSKNDGNSGSTVEDGQNGFIFDPNSAEELANRMKLFIEFPHLIKEMGRESERKAWNLRPERSAESLLQALAE